MRAHPPTAFSQNDVDQTSTSLCHIMSAKVCIWVMFVLIIAASVKIGYIRQMLPSANGSTGIQGAVNFFGKLFLIITFLMIFSGFLAVMLWIPIYWVWVTELMTAVWATMLLTSILSIGAMGFSIQLVSFIDNHIAVSGQNPAPVSQVKLESGQTVNVVQNPNPGQNFWAAKQCANALALANFGIFGCTVSYVILMYECSIGIYFW